MTHLLFWFRDLVILISDDIALFAFELVSIVRLSDDRDAVSRHVQEIDFCVWWEA